MRSFDAPRSRALWNRSRVDLESDEILAQILDRGDLRDWRELYRLASGQELEACRLRRRIVMICRTVPVAFPHLFLAAMGALGEEIDPYPEIVAPNEDLA